MRISQESILSKVTGQTNLRFQISNLSSQIQISARCCQLSALRSQIYLKPAGGADLGAVPCLELFCLSTFTRVPSDYASITGRSEDHRFSPTQPTDCSAIVYPGLAGKESWN
jgi:hypothetical protein